MEHKTLKAKIIKYLFKYIGEISPDQQDELLPSEKALMNKFNCSRETVRSALIKLVYHGIILPVKGKGYIISKKLTNLHYSFNVDIATIKSKVEIIHNQNYFNGIKNNLTYTKKYFYQNELVAWSLCAINKEIIYNITKHDLEKGLINFLMKNDYDLFKIEKISEVHNFTDQNHIYSKYVKDFNLQFSGTTPIVFTRLFNKSNDILEVSIVFVNAKYYRAEEHIIF